MLFSSEFNGFFVRSIRALEPYLNDVICGGGVANALYRHHPYSSEVDWGYVGTGDLDMLTPQKLPSQGNQLLAERLDEAGLEERIFGSADQAVVKFVSKAGEFDGDLEFLCPMTGLKGGRLHIPQSFTIQAGLKAQPLKYLEIPLFSNPWELSLHDVPGMEDVADLTVRLPNPAAYILQKILIRDQGRKQTSMDKDCLYIYEVSVIFRDHFDAIREEYIHLDPCHPKWKQKFEIEASRLFSSSLADGPLTVEEICADSGHSLDLRGTQINSEMVYHSVSKLLEALFA